MKEEYNCPECGKTLEFVEVISGSIDDNMDGSYIIDTYYYCSECEQEFDVDGIRDGEY